MSLKNLNVIKTRNLASKLSNNRIKNLFKKFEKNFEIKDDFAVAVSGGPDSLALTFLTKIYALKYNLNCKYFIVDHRLRKESTQEAKRVKKILKNFGIKLEILTWKGKKPLK
jgi:tRNA(Ile)-lysidine synthase